MEEHEINGDFGREIKQYRFKKERFVLAKTLSEVINKPDQKTAPGELLIVNAYAVGTSDQFAIVQSIDLLKAVLSGALSFTSAIIVAEIAND